MESISLEMKIYILNKSLKYKILKKILKYTEEILIIYLKNLIQLKIILSRLDLKDCII